MALASPSRPESAKWPMARARSSPNWCSCRARSAAAGDRLIDRAISAPVSKRFAASVSARGSVHRLLRPDWHDLRLTGQGLGTMERAAYDRMKVLETTHWWFLGRR